MLPEQNANLRSVEFQRDLRLPTISQMAHFVCLWGNAIKTLKIEDLGTNNIQPSTIAGYLATALKEKESSPDSYADVMTLTEAYLSIKEPSAFREAAEKHQEAPKEHKRAPKEHQKTLREDEKSK